MTVKLWVSEQFCRLTIYSLKRAHVYCHWAPKQFLMFLTCGMTYSLCQSHTGSDSSSNSRKEMLPKPITIVTSESSSPCFVRPEEFSFGSSHAVTTQTPAQVAQHLLPKATCGISLTWQDAQRNKHTNLLISTLKSTPTAEAFIYSTW